MYCVLPISVSLQKPLPVTNICWNMRGGLFFVHLKTCLWFSVQEHVPTTCVLAHNHVAFYPCMHFCATSPQFWNLAEWTATYFFNYTPVLSLPIFLYTMDRICYMIPSIQHNTCCSAFNCHGVIGKTPGRLRQRLWELIEGSQVRAPGNILPPQTSPRKQTLSSQTGTQSKQLVLHVWAERQPLLRTCYYSNITRDLRAEVCKLSNLTDSKFFQ